MGPAATTGSPGHVGMKRYERLIIDHPGPALIVLAVLLVFFAYHAQDFRLDASADSLLLEDDKDLETYRNTQRRYGTPDSLIVTFTPAGDLFSAESLAAIAEMSDALRQVPSVESVQSLLDSTLR